MGSTSDLSQLAYDIQGSEHFSEGARQLLERLLDVLGKSTIPGLVLRGVLHLRFDDAGYRDLVMVERGESVDELDQIRPSTTAWRYISEDPRAVALDVITGRFSLPGDGSDCLEQQDMSDASLTIESLRARGTTHILVLPLQDSHGRVRGMVSLEMNSRDVIGGDYPWLQVLPELLARMVISAPYLLALPMGSRSSKSELDVLPVESRWVDEIADLLSIFARQRQTIFITGPTGGGKTYLARWIHEASRQQADRFVHIPLNQLSDDTGLAQLFGWRKGAFTGATSDNSGWVAQGENGTLFFDDVDCLSSQQQEGLLRFLDTHQYRRLNDSTDRTVENTRIIVATNANLRQLVAEGRFREDLYHRINIFHLLVPALSERRDEIPAWIQIFGDEAHRASGLSGGWTMTSAALEMLVRHPWTGNLRELQRTVQMGHVRAQVGNEMSDTVIDGNHVAQELNDDYQTTGPIHHLYTAGKALFEEALSEGGSVDSVVFDSKGLLYDMMWLIAYEILGDDVEARSTTARVMRQTGALEFRNYIRIRRQAAERLHQFYVDHGAVVPASLRKLIAH